MTDLLPLAALFVCFAVVTALAYWLGFRHGSSHAASRPPVEHVPEPEPPHIPAYRVRELTVLMELGVLTPEEFEEEKGKLHAGRLA